MSQLVSSMVPLSVIILVMALAQSNTIPDPKIGHGIIPNLSPRLSPAVQTETVPDMKDLLSIQGKSRVVAKDLPIDTSNFYRSHLWARGDTS